MTPRSFDEQELVSLFGAVRDDQATPAQIARLEEIMRTDPGARQYYLRCMAIHGFLEQSSVPLPNVAPQASRRRSPRWLGLALAAAAAILLAVVAWRVIRPTDRAREVAWIATPAGDARYERLSPTSIRLEEGEIRVRTEHEAGTAGTPMTVETPNGTVTITGSDAIVGAHKITPSEANGGSGMRYFTRVLVLAGVVTLVNPHGTITGEANNLLAAEPNKAPVKQVVDANTGFAIDLYRQLTKTKPGQNAFFSPYSISLALAMTAEGARGETADQMGKVLHFPKEARRIGDDAQMLPWQTAMMHTGLAQISRDLMAPGKPGAGKFDLKIANALWGDKSYRFRDTFVKALSDSYGVGGAFPCDFAGNAEAERARINDWVADATKKLIQDLLPPGSVGPQTRMVLTNAIYFKGDWVQKFDKRSTKAADFTNVAGTRVRATMMSGTFFDARFAFIGKGDQAESLEANKADNFRLLELPYKGGLTMLLIATDNPRGLPTLETTMTAANLDRWIGQMRAEKTVDVTLPRFKLSTDYPLQKPLEQLGMTRAFLPPGPDGADFSGMSQSGERELTIGGVFHKAFVAVNEEGTEAAAATGVPGLTGPAPKLPPRFFGDRPFVFLIRDPASRTILFMGRLADPTGAANNDLSDADKAAIELARTQPEKHPIYQRLKSAEGVALMAPYTEGGFTVGNDGMGRLVFKNTIGLSLRGELKENAVVTLAFEPDATDSEYGREYWGFGENLGKRRSLLTYKRIGNKWVVDGIFEADVPALLVTAHVFSVEFEKLKAATTAGK